MNKETRNYCGVKFELHTALSKEQRDIIDQASKRNHMVKVVLPKGKGEFIIVFENRLHRDSFITAITPQLYGEIKYSYVNNIKMEQ